MDVGMFTAEVSMRKVNAQAKRVLDRLTEGLAHPGDHKKIKNNEAYMPVNVDFVNKTAEYELFAVSHTSIQNGDVMFDPEMCFLRINGEYYPESYRNDYVGLCQYSVVYDDDGKIKGVRPKLQKDHAIFAGSWMANIKDQQGV